MKAMILAAGEGRRMRPLTLNVPKPLLRVDDHSLIEHQIVRLRAAGIHDVVINVAYLADTIQSALGDGSSMGVNITYSVEPEPLETGGAVNRALPILGAEPFLLINGDVWCDYPLANLKSRGLKDALGHLVLVDNPSHNKGGDFLVKTGSGCLSPVDPCSTDIGLTFSGISLLSPRLVSEYPSRRKCFPLREALQWAMMDGYLTGERFAGFWCDVGTPERLAALRERVCRGSASWLDLNP